MKSLIPNQRIVNLIVIALFTMLFAGCAVAPKAENLSMATTAAHIRADSADDLQPNPSDSPEFIHWGPVDD